MAVQLSQEMINSAINTQTRYGVPASVTLGQIMLESGGDYPSGLSGLAYIHNNLFGIKAGGSWTGKTVSLQTKEYGKNGEYYTHAEFRKYNSVSESIEDHARLLSSPTYTNKTAGTTNLNDYVKAMGSVYATDPNYSDKLLKVIDDNNLTQYDTGNYNITYTGDSSVMSSGGSDIKVLGFDITDFISKIVIFICIVLVVVLSVVFFMQAFDVHIPTKKDITKTVEEAVTNE